MNILYWICFIYLVAMCCGALFRTTKDGFADCDTFGKVFGNLAGIITVIGLLVGVIYFYLH